MFTPCGRDGKETASQLLCPLIWGPNSPASFIVSVHVSQPHSQGRSRGGDLALGCPCGLYGPCLAALWDQRDLLGLLSLLSVLPTELDPASLHLLCRHDPLHETRPAESLLGLRELPLPSCALKLCLFCIRTDEGQPGSTTAWTRPCCGGLLLHRGLFPSFKGFTEIPFWKQIPTSQGDCWLGFWMLHCIECLG